ncbi:MAG: twin-arginine translocase TatA/TatE family subunit [Synergistaceae bacterium]|nr:twin-arginine translocase TatA/TatE family subunit [Synergistaceae bacterium]MBR0035152.1 twin-arginine translocase TatA/TatE family subunit [Synergistaceae bacterium]
MRLGATEIILIIILALVLFGGGKLASVGKSLGKSIKDFKNEIKDDKPDTTAKRDSGSEPKA